MRLGPRREPSQLRSVMNAKSLSRLAALALAVLTAFSLGFAAAKSSAAPGKIIIDARAQATPVPHFGSRCLALAVRIWLSASAI
jgi:hypothetical protein